MEKTSLNEVKISQVRVKDSFWSARQKLVADVVIPYQEKILNDEIEGVEKSHAFANFRIAAGLEEGEFSGMVFQDSDVAKWLEGVAYSLTVQFDEALKARADSIIDIIAKAQQPDGYLNTYFTIKEPERRWQNLHECHELYCAGHMMEAAAAYYEATGEEKLLKVMEKMADHIAERFGADKATGIPGHQEIEIGLMRLFHATGREKYRKLAQYFIDERGKNPDFFKDEKKKRGWTHFNMDASDTCYNQSFAPVRMQKTAEGHAVRAVYMYTAMADIAAQTGEQELTETCITLWNNITEKRMYLTGGIGSTGEGEAFTIDYDLPNDMAYSETCAAIGLVFFARKMLNMFPSNKYADIMELALYNGVLSGMQMDGKSFFYVNPLEVHPEVSGRLPGYKHVLPERPGWYECACCPPNLVRLIMSLGRYAWSQSEDTIYSHLLIGGEADFSQAFVEVAGKMPWEGEVIYTIHPKKEAAFTLAVRIPSYVTERTLLLNGKEVLPKKVEEGYLYFTEKWQDGDKICITFSMPVRRVYSNTAVRENENCVALMRGPLVYCFEGTDNGDFLQKLRIPEDALFEAELEREGLFAGMHTISFTGKKMESGETLYSSEKPHGVPWKMKAIPYFAWGNRGVNQMRVWMPECV